MDDPNINRSAKLTPQMLEKARSILRLTPLEEYFVILTEQQVLFIAAYAPEHFRIKDGKLYFQSCFGCGVVYMQYRKGGPLTEADYERIKAQAEKIKEEEQ